MNRVTLSPNLPRIYQSTLVSVKNKSISLPHTLKNVSDWTINDMSPYTLKDKIYCKRE